MLADTVELVVVELAVVQGNVVVLHMTWMKQVLTKKSKAEQ